MKTIFKIILLAALLAVAWVAISPYRTVQKLTSAIESENADAAAQYVDFDAVRYSMQNDFMRRFGAKPDGTGVGDRIASSLAGSFISMAVTPQAMVFVFKDQDRRDAMGLTTSYATLLTHGRWVDTSNFILTNHDSHPTMLLTRNGLHWTVTALRLK